MKNKALSAIISVILCILIFLSSLAAILLFVTDEYFTARSFNEQTKDIDVSLGFNKIETTPIVAEFSDEAVTTADVIADSHFVASVYGSRNKAIIVGEAAAEASDHAREVTAEYFRQNGILFSGTGDIYAKATIYNVFSDAYAAYAYENGMISGDESKINCKTEIAKDVSHVLSVYQYGELYSVGSIGSQLVYFVATGERGKALTNFCSCVTNEANSFVSRAYCGNVLDYVRNGGTRELTDVSDVDTFILDKMKEAAQIYDFPISESDEKIISSATQKYLDADVSPILSNFPTASDIDAVVGSGNLNTIRFVLKPVVYCVLAGLALIFSALVVLVWKQKKCSLSFIGTAFLLTGAALFAGRFFIDTIDASAYINLGNAALTKSICDMASVLLNGYANKLTGISLYPAVFGFLLIIAAIVLSTLKKKES